MKKFITFLFLLLFIQYVHAQEQSPTCLLYPEGPYTACVNETLLFIADCQNISEAEFLWQVQQPGGSYQVMGQTEQLNYTFSQAGTHLIHCAITRNAVL